MITIDGWLLGERWLAGRAGVIAVRWVWPSHIDDGNTSPWPRGRIDGWLLGEWLLAGWRQW